MAVPQGNIVGFQGRNGSGKTTTIKILLDVIPRTSGEATVPGEPTGSIAVRRRIGFLGEDKRLYSYMTVRRLLHSHVCFAFAINNSTRDIESLKRLNLQDATTPMHMIDGSTYLIHG